MILNKNLTLSDRQAITATAISENVIQWPAMGVAPNETGSIQRNLGAGTEIPMLIQVTEDFNTLTTLTIDIVTADNAALTTNAEVLSSSGAIPLASLKAGFRPSFTRVLPDGKMKDYFGMKYTVAGTNPTTGKITAAVATEVNT